LAAAFPRYHLLGQSKEGLTLFPEKDFHDPKGRMSVEEHLREVAEYQIEAVEPFDGDDIDCIETGLKQMVRQADGNLLLDCLDGSKVFAKRVFMATGLGPERGLQHSGVLFRNQALPARCYHR
jgi:hypothetical protein